MANDIKADIKQTSARAIHKTAFDGMLIFDLNIFEDNRGVFTEVWQTEAMQELGLPEVNPKQLGISRSKKGTIRAIHAEPYDKIVHVIAGRIFCAMVDLRQNSPTFGQIDTFELDNSNMLFIPNGIGNAFQAVSDEDVLYCYCVSGVWSADKAYSGQYVAVNYADPDLAIQWPIGPENQIVSLKDRSNKTMRELFPERYL
jgi:dTDP-4-dehydrorhamnose 3,5-epimerase/reductase